MRKLPLPALFLCLSLPVQAEVIEAQGKITAVTLYPSGAKVVRKVEFTAPAGTHQILFAGLPLETDVSTLRVIPSDGLAVGAVSLAADRLPSVSDSPRPDVKAAQDEVARLEDVLRDKQAAIEAIRLKVDAADEQVAFLHGLGQSGATGGLVLASPDTIHTLTAMVGDEVLAARQKAEAAEAEAQAAERALKDDEKALEKARQTLAALTDSDAEQAVLTLNVETSGDGPASFEISTYTEAAWAPVYDLYLTREGGNALAIDRGVLVTQNSGEDWRGVDLTLSTSRPGERSEPSGLWPRRLQIISDEERAARTALLEAGEAGGMADPVMEEPVVEQRVSSFIPDMSYQGTTVNYHYPKPVDLRSEVEAVRLPLDHWSTVPDLHARAVPKLDETAYLMAKFTNDTNAVILPGQAMLYSDGALVGQSQLALIAAGDKAELGFGAIDGIRLTRSSPDRMEGQEGILSTSNQQEETAILTVENLTTEEWQVELFDQVPYSEQKDLTVTYSATPPESAANVDDQHGVLRWDLSLAAGAKQDITLKQSISWPDGMVLQ